MSPERSRAAPPETVEPERAEEAAEMRDIDHLIAQCTKDLGSITMYVSATTVSQTESMYDDIRREALKNPSLRAERVQWMKENAKSMESLTVRAPSEYRRFHEELAHALAAKLIDKNAHREYLAAFENPSWPEMERHHWFEETWTKRYETWKKLEDKRRSAEKAALAAGLTEWELPRLATLRNDEKFLALDDDARLSLINETEAAIPAAANGMLGRMKRLGAELGALSSGPGRILHPSMVGSWLKTFMSDPKAWSASAIANASEQWRAERGRFDALAHRYAQEGMPDGCAPMDLDAFLRLPPSGLERALVLAEWENRLNAAKRLGDAGDAAFEREKKAIRASIDLHDLDAAEARLDRLGRTDDEDIRTITAHLALLRAKEEARADERDETERTAEAFHEIRAVEEGVDPRLRPYIAAICRGDAGTAAMFLHALHVREERLKGGATTHREEARHDRLASDVAAESREATFVETDDNDELLVAGGTPPEEAFALLREHAARGSSRAPALVFADVPYDRLPSGHVNRRLLANLRHLEKVGMRYDDAETTVA